MALASPSPAACFHPRSRLVLVVVAIARIAEPRAARRQTRAAACFSSATARSLSASAPRSHSTIPASIQAHADPCGRVTLRSASV